MRSCQAPLLKNWLEAQASPPQQKQEGGTHYEIGFGFLLWKNVKTCKSFWGYYWTLIFKGKRLVWIHPVSRETIFGILDHLKLHNYGGAIHPCIPIGHAILLLYGNIVYRTQIETSNFIQVQASLVFAVISAFWFSGFSRFTIYKLITIAIAFLIAFLIKINNKKLNQIISKLLTLYKYFTCSLVLFCTCGTFLSIPRGYLHYNW